MNISGLATLGVLLLAATRPAVSDDDLNSLDLGEADARNEAYEIMSAAEAQFDCKLEEHSMQGIGNEPDVRYVFHVRTKGAECRAALVFATNLAARNDRILFRNLQQVDGEQSDSEPPGIRLNPMEPFLLPDEQVLIHEVNPTIDGTAPPEE